jgi:hypothetical protein
LLFLEANRRFEGAASHIAGEELKTAVNAAIRPERPLLVKGGPGAGKALPAHQIDDASPAGLYEYDAGLARAGGRRLQWKRPATSGTLRRSTARRVF